MPDQANPPAGEKQANPPTGEKPAKSPPPFFVKPDGSYIEKFWEHPAFPPDLRENLQIRTHKTLADTYKNWSTLEKIRGNDVVPIPGPNADPAVVDQTLWRRLGWPEKPEGYEVPSVTEAGLSEEHKAPEPVLAAFRAAAHAARLTQGQLKTLLGEWNKFVAAEVAASAEQGKRDADSLVAPLRREWGGQFDANAALAESFARSQIPAADFERLKGSGLLSDPAVLRLFHGLAGKSKEAEPDLSRPVPADVAAQAEAKLRSIQNDLKGPLYDRDHPLHDQARGEFEQLRTIVERARAARRKAEGGYVG